VSKGKNMKRKIRVLVGKPGLDGHERGVRALILGLRNEGMEVIYTGIRLSPEQIVSAAIQEDVDVVGLSCHTGAHKLLFSRVARLLREKEKHVLLLGGGIIPEKDVPFLKEHGFKGIFGPGARIADIADFIKANVGEACQNLGDREGKAST
jgi:methylmalonyl-CoA mutase, C-terminal domain